MPGRRAAVSPAISTVLIRRPSAPTGRFTPAARRVSDLRSGASDARRARRTSARREPTALWLDAALPVAARAWCLRRAYQSASLLSSLEHLLGLGDGQVAGCRRCPAAVHETDVAQFRLPDDRWPPAAEHGRERRHELLRGNSRPANRSSSPARAAMRSVTICGPSEGVSPCRGGPVPYVFPTRRIGPSQPDATGSNNRCTEPKGL